MFNTMTITKAAGALIGALLFMMLASWAASGIFHMGPPGGDHHAEGEAPAQAYTIEVAESDAGGAAEAEEVDFAALMESADPAAGEKGFGKCRACHKLDGSDGTGPHLNGVVGRPMASSAGYAYSDAMKAHVADYPEWTPEALFHFLTNPKAEVPGTKMAFAGIRRPQEIADLVAYLEQNP